MVTTVAYPVVRPVCRESEDEDVCEPMAKVEQPKHSNATVLAAANHQFMGVAGVTVPMIELRQMAPVYRVRLICFVALLKFI
jgi:hypothetical protein